MNSYFFDNNYQKKKFPYKIYFMKNVKDKLEFIRILFEEKISYSERDENEFKKYVKYLGVRQNPYLKFLDAEIILIEREINNCLY